MRILIDISNELAADLDRFAAERSVTRMSVIREAIAGHLAQQAPPANVMASHFGSWANRPGDSLVIEAAYREEW